MTNSGRPVYYRYDYRENKAEFFNYQPNLFLHEHFIIFEKSFKS